ncbi:hypothetical protein HN803_05460 [candidate division WWE3 bacterium]|jgi:hypothetical protein|nr:hypothetical protein [candidate division WWE3 bacterium]MBT7350210.1 hypothetical protein [candidate division WWE3 bacterium]
MSETQQQETNIRFSVSLTGWHATVAWLAPIVTFFWVLITDGDFIPVVIWTILVGVIVFVLMGFLSGSIKTGDDVAMDFDE